MADTPTYWRFSKEDVAKFGEALRLLGGVPVAPRALLIEDAEGAVERMLDCLPRILAEAWNARWWAKELLRAAAGEGEE